MELNLVYVFLLKLGICSRPLFKFSFNVDAVLGLIRFLGAKFKNIPVSRKIILKGFDCKKLTQWHGQMLWEFF